MRHNLDLLAAHSRELVRHAIMIILLAGTVSGTIWTFSDGKLTLTGAWERVISVGGIALALEIGGIFTGLYIQALDSRIQTARRRDQAENYRTYRRQIYFWFGGILAISFVANLLFRAQQLGDVRLAAFVSLAPIVLICLFTIVLRPLPIDYAELGRQATQRGLLVLTRNAQGVMLSYMRDVGRGSVPSPEKQKAMALAAGFLRTYAQVSEQQALDYAMSTGGGADTIDTSAVELLSSADVRDLYHVPLRTAQEWIKSTPARRRATSGNKWLAPASAIYQAHGVPRPSDFDRSASLVHMQDTQDFAGSAQADALEAQP